MAGMIPGVTVVPGRSAFPLLINSRSAAWAYVRAPLRRRTSAALPAWSNMTVRQDQMPDISRIVSRVLHRFEYGFSFIRPSSIDQKRTILCF